MRRIFKSCRSRVGGSFLLVGAAAIVVVVLVLPTTAFGAKRSKALKKGGSGDCGSISSIPQQKVRRNKFIIVLAADPAQNEVTFSTTKGGKHGTTGTTVAPKTIRVRVPNSAVSGPIWVGDSDCTGMDTRWLHINGE